MQYRVVMLRERACCCSNEHCFTEHLSFLHMHHTQQHNIGPNLCLSLQAGDATDASEGSKKRWYEEKKKRQEEQLAKLGLTPEEAHRLESAEVAEAKYKKKVCWGSSV